MSGFSRRYRIDSIDKWQSILRLLLAMKPDCHQSPIMLAVYEERNERSGAQRAMWHATVDELATKMGHTPREMKKVLKREYFGVETRTVAGHPYEFVRSTEELDRKQYAELIDFTLRWAAENGIVISDRRTK